MSQKKNKKTREILKFDKDNRFKADLTISIVSILKQNWVFLLGLLLGTILVYFNSLHGDFVSDDYAGITQNPDVTNIAKSITDGLRSSPRFINAFIASIFGVGSPIPFHVFSLIVFMIALVVAFLLIDLSFGRRIAQMATILFAVLSVHVEAVSWISGRPYVLNAIAIISGLLLFGLYNATLQKKYLTYFCILLPLFIYFEPVRFIAFPLILPFYVYIFCKNIDFKVFIKNFFIVCFLLGIIGAIALSGDVSNRITTVNSGYNSSESIFYDPFFQYPTSIAKYLQLIFVPADLTLYHTMYVFPAWLNWSISILYLVNLGYFWFKNKKLFFCLLFIFLATAPSMAPLKVSWLVAERYVFLGSLGFVIFLALILDEFYKRISMLAVVVFAVMVSFFGWRTYLRNIDWQTNHNLWVNTCLVSPNSHNAWNNIGDDYDKLKEYDNAIKGFTQSTVVKQNYADAYHNRGNIFFKMGRLDLARDSYLTALHYSPELFHSYLSLVQIDLMEKNANQAVADAQSVIRLQPNSPQSWYVYGVVLAQLGQIPQAKESFTKALQIDPTYQLAREALTKI